MYKNLGKLSTYLLLTTATAVILTGCSTSQSAGSDMKFTETPKAKIDKGMENQPESSYWFPEDLLVWDFEKDLDAKYNVSSIPLAKRVEKKELPKANKTQNDEMNVVALSIMNSSTSGNAPRGINNFDANVFSYWQYIDQLVYWGGSSGEGIIVPPSPDVIDSAHKNGVPVLGTIFFPQTAHGGKIEWLETFLTKDDKGEFPIVDKMIEVAEVYGFDGWFINQETDTEVTSFDEVKNGKKTEEKEKKEEGLRKEHADLMQELIKEFKNKSKDKLDIMWYDSMTSDGKMDWQNALTDKNKDYMVDANMEPLSDSMFLNFWWNTEELAKKELLKSSNEKAKELKIDPYDLYAGIDVQENGYMTPVNWNLFTDDKGSPYTSLGLYVPSWTHASSDNPTDFEEKESIFWVNDESDSSKGKLPKGEEWPGISTFSVEQTSITELPFVTNFSLGNGYNYFIDGEKVSSMEWNNRSMQDILPTYRWQFDHEKENKLDATMDYTEAYQGGNSLKLRGQMDKKTPSKMKLYETKVNLSKDVTFTTTAKASEETELNLILGFVDGSNKTIKPDKMIDKDWTTVTYDMKKIGNKTITSIDYEIISQTKSDTYEMKFGQISVLPKMKDDKISVKNLKIEDAIFDEEESNFAGVRLIWEESRSSNLSHYEIFRVNKDKTRTFLGATPANNFYINGLERQKEEIKTDFEVVPVSIKGKEGKASNSVTMEWPDNTVPKASFKASRTLIAPGESVTFNNTSSKNTDSVTWEFEGANIETSKEKSPTVTFKNPGVYQVKLTAKNKSGKTQVEMKDLITVDDKASGDLKLLSKGAKTEASSFVNDGEAPEFAVDGKLDTKWCATGNPPHHITVDLGSIKTVSEVHIGHAEAGGEGADMNTRAYTIEVSEDGKDFKQVTRVIGNESGETVDTFAATKARFVRLTTDKPTQGSDTAVRIYDLGVYGLK